MVFHSLKSLKQIILTKNCTKHHSTGLHGICVSVSYNAEYYYFERCYFSNWQEQFWGRTLRCETIFGDWKPLKNDERMLFISPYCHVKLIFCLAWGTKYLGARCVSFRLNLLSAPGVSAQGLSKARAVFLQFPDKMIYLMQYYFQ